jgi:two-component system chemotaxis response regulator CheY
VTSRLARPGRDGSRPARRQPLQVQIYSLLTLVCATVSSGWATIAVVSAGGDKRSGEHSVLIVEDSENSAATLEIALLGIPGVSVRLASSAVQALRILQEPDSGIQAVVTDLNMPRMDGFELIERIRGDHRLCGTPIIVVSADTDPSTPERIAQLGVSAFFPKPYSPAQVRRKMEQILNATVP